MSISAASILAASLIITPMHPHAPEPLPYKASEVKQVKGKTDPLMKTLHWHKRMQEYVKHQRKLERQARREARLARAAAAEAAARSYSSSPALSSSLNWAALRDCESNGNYAINTGNGYYGAYQFSLSTWRAMGGSGYPHLASPAEQDRLAQKLYDAAGASPWPVCGARL